MKFRNKHTGEIAEQIPIFEMDDWEEVRGPDNKVMPKSKKLKGPVKLYGQMHMKPNGDIVYISGGGYESRPFDLNLQESAPKAYKSIIDTYGKSNGAETREKVYLAIAKTLDKNWG